MRRRTRTATLFLSIGFLAAALASGCASTTSRRGTEDEARQMLDRAVIHYQQVGRDRALADFTARRSPFFDRDLYVFCYGPERTISAHGGDPRIVGTDIDSLRDVDGNAFGTEIMRVAQSSQEGGRTEYKWLNPASGAIEPKVSFVRQIGSDVCGVGAYREQ